MWAGIAFFIRISYIKWGVEVEPLIGVEASTPDASHMRQKCYIVQTIYELVAQTRREFLRLLLLHLDKWNCVPASTN